MGFSRQEYWSELPFSSPKYYWVFSKRHCFFIPVHSVEDNATTSSKSILLEKVTLCLITLSQIELLYQDSCIIIGIVVVIAAFSSFHARQNKSRWNLKSSVQKIPLLFSNSMQSVASKHAQKGNRPAISNTFPIKEEEINLQNIEWKGQGEISWQVSPIWKLAALLSHINN